MTKTKTIALSIIFMIVGLPTFFMGCNKEVTSFCPNYNILDGYIYDTKITKTTCSSSKKKADCWYVYAYASLLNDTSVSCRCPVNQNDVADSETEANTLASKYYVGKQVVWYKRKNTNVCFKSSIVKHIWYVGLVFICLSGATWLVVIYENSCMQEEEKLNI